jgi:phage baseplate assembly protein W
MSQQVTFSLTAKSDGFEVSIIESYANIFTTPKNTVAMLPEFGCDFHELIDRRIDDEFLIDYRRVLMDASIWETRKVLESVRVVDVDAINGSIKTRLNFTDGSYIEGVFSGFA